MKIRRPRKTDMVALLAASVIAFFLILLMQTLFAGIKKEKYEENWRQVVFLVNNRCVEAETVLRMSDVFSDQIFRMLIFFEHLDQNQYIFSAVYDEDYNILTARIPRWPEYPFLPFTYNAIKEKMALNGLGSVDVVYTANKNVYDMRFYFRKIHTSDGHVWVTVAIPYIADDIIVTSYLTYLVLFISLAAAIAGITVHTILFTNSLRPRYIRLIKEI